MSSRRSLHLLLVALAACGGQSQGNSDAGGPVLDSSAADAGAPDARAPIDASAPGDAAPDASNGASNDAAQPDAAAPEICPPERIVADGCQSLAGDEFAAGRCDGLDNDCNGSVDDGCPCTPGAVQSCFDGPPGRVATGACRRGMQVCQGGEFPGWGACDHSITPIAEACDRLDNDCNGCTDELESCPVFIDCPGAGDPRLPPAKPFEAYALDASRFYNGNDVASYSWTVEGSPCDALFLSIPGSRANATNGQLSYVVSGANQRQMSVKFSLSGTYLVTLSITRRSGQVLSCTFPIVVGAPGLRVELCWDKTGPTSGANGIDLDLHLALKGQTASWGLTSLSAKDCYYDTCFPENLGLGVWGHPNTPEVRGCLTGNASQDQVHMIRNNCINPRIDLDNRGDTDLTRYLPENINLDRPRAGEHFQVAVNHKSSAAVATRALVNVYCAGRLKGSYALDPLQADFSSKTLETELWRVVEIAPAVNAQGLTTDCTLTPLVAPNGGTGTWVSESDSSITWSN